MSNERSNPAVESSTSGLEQLLAADLPLIGPTAAAEKLLSISAKVFRRNRLALIWQPRATRHIKAILWASNEIPHEFKLEARESLSDLIVIPGHLPAELCDLKWERLPVTAGDEFFLGSDPAFDSPRFTDEWKLAVSKLFSWALRFDQSLLDRKMTALAEYAAGAGHEINNPLGSIIGRTSQLLKTESDPERRRLLETIGAQAYRIRDMIGDTMLFAAPPAASREPTDLGKLIEVVLSRFQSELEQARVQLDLIKEEAVCIFADPVQLQIVCSELIRNAINALSELSTGDARELRIRYSKLMQSGRPGGFLEISDSGPGMAQEQYEHCFDPFFSGRQAGRGLGFGLSKCWRIVEQHRGEISIQREESKTYVRIWIPSDKEKELSHHHNIS